MQVQIEVYRFNPEFDITPRSQNYQLTIQEGKDPMLLDILMMLKEQDESLTFRKSCREGVCGSDGVNVNGKNILACITPLSRMLKKQKLSIRPLPGLPVVRDLVIDMKPFYKQFEKARPYLINDEPAPAIERLQSPKEREKLDGLYECVLCACCSTSCPSFWWNPDKFMGPAALLQSYRFLSDSRDKATDERLEDMQDHFSIYRCRSIMNCADVCPKGLNPSKAISGIRAKLFQSAV